MRLLSPLAVVASATMVLCGCNDNSCYNNGSALPLVRFYQSGTKTQVAVTALTIKGVDAPRDSVLIDGATIGEVYLPLRATTNTAQWALIYADEETLPDTLTLRYEPIPYFASAECGAMYNFRLTDASVTTHAIDSLQVVKTLINNGTDVALRLFFANDE